MASLACPVCSAILPNKKAVTRHLREVHKTKSSQRQLCPLDACEKPMPQGYHKHLKDCHPEIHLDFEYHVFQNFNGKLFYFYFINISHFSFLFLIDFEKWKNTVSHSTFSQFTVEQGSQTTEIVYRCCHYGNYSSVVDPWKVQRHSKDGETKKLGKICPARIKAKNLGERIEVEWCKTHHGHGLNTSNHQISKIDLKWLEECFTFGLTNKQIRKKVLTSAAKDIEQNKELSRVHYLTADQIRYYRRKYNQQTHIMLDKDDMKSVSLLIQQLNQEKQTRILYFKQQSEESKSVFDFGTFRKEDLCIIMSSEFQIQMFQQFGNDLLLIDGTHGTNRRNFQLTVVLVLDQLR